MAVGIILENLRYDKPPQRNVASLESFESFLQTNHLTLSQFESFADSNSLLDARISGSTTRWTFNRSSDIDLIRFGSVGHLEISILDFSGIRVDVETYPIQRFSEIKEKIASAADLSERVTELDWSELKFYLNFQNSLLQPNYNVSFDEVALSFLALYLARRRYAKAESLLQDVAGAIYDGEFEFALSRGKTALDESIDSLLASLGDSDVQRKRRVEKLARLSSESLDIMSEYIRLNRSWPTTERLKKEICKDMFRLSRIIQTTASAKIDSSTLTSYPNVC